MNGHLPIRVPCPCGCYSHAKNRSGPVNLIPILGKEPGEREAKIMALKCPKCKFDAYASKEYQEKYGDPSIPYWDGRKIIRPSEEICNVVSESMTNSGKEAKS